MNQIYRKKTLPLSLYILLFIFYFLFPVRGYGAQDKANADAAFRSGHYQKAITHYNAALKQGQSAETYYNMGNAYFRMGDYPEAMIAYQRAARLSPANSDIKHNIEITANKTIDRLPVSSDIFFIEWYKAFVCLLSIDNWAVISIVAFALSLICFLLYLFVQQIGIRRISFYSSVVLALTFLFSILFAWHQHKMLLAKDKGVVTAEMVTVKSSPTHKSSDAFVIHEGTSVNIKDSDIKGWYQIELSDGRQGWMPSASVEVI